MASECTHKRQILTAHVHMQKFVFSFALMTIKAFQVMYLYIYRESDLYQSSQTDKASAAETDCFPLFPISHSQI